MSSLRAGALLIDASPPAQISPEKKGGLVKLKDGILPPPSDDFYPCTLPTDRAISYTAVSVGAGGVSDAQLVMVGEGEKQFDRRKKFDRNLPSL